VTVTRTHVRIKLCQRDKAIFSCHFSTLLADFTGTAPMSTRLAIQHTNVHLIGSFAIFVNEDRIEIGDVIAREFEKLNMTYIRHIRPRPLRFCD
jgi:hypothetical protein